MAIPKRLRRALESDCGHTLEEVLEDKTPEAFEALRGVLADKKADPARRQNALSLLGRWGDPGAVPDIVKLLPKLSERERINAIDALGRLGTPEALAAVSGQLEDPDPDVRRFAVYALDRIGSGEALELLKQVAAGDPAGFVRSKAAALLRARAGGGQKGSDR